jgi:aspartyl-tRNA synthetase
MISGMDRYYQIVKCFRDEDLRADRQPEFTQIDVEMSFVEMDDVIEVNERLLQKIFKEIKGIDIQIPFMRMPYSDAMDRFGSDKPDTRFGLELKNITEDVKNCEFKVFTDVVAMGGTVRAINATNLGDKLTRKKIDALGEFVKTYKAKALAWIKVNPDGIQSPIAKFLTEDEMNAILNTMDAKENDVIFIIADKDPVVFASLGALRLEIAKTYELIDENKFNFLWVTDFPLLEYDEEENRYVAMHHPFTSPKDEDLELLDTDPGKVHAKAYDIILNGVELGGGSIRIYNSELQEKMFSVLGFTKEDAWARFGFLMEALKYGTPPHGGMAYGFDRMIMLMDGCESIRDVIAFPKVQNASELMSGAPDVVEVKQLDELGIELIKTEE